MRSDVASAEASSAYGTPTFFVVGNRRHTGSYDADTLSDVLDQLRSLQDPATQAEAPTRD